MSQTMIEKIAQKYAVGLAENIKVHSGDYISIAPAYILTHDNTGAVIPKFKSIGAKKFHYPHQIVNALDHNVQDKSEKNLEKYKKIEEFSKSNGADFYPAGRGIGHQIMCEEGYVFPGTMVVASDSHSNMYGGLGCLGTPIVRTDAAAIWATGRTWWQVPPVAKVELTGKLNPGVSGKDVIIALCGFFNKDEVLNFAIEFTGEGIQYLSVDERLTIANMTTEWGALAGVFPTDNVTFDWLNNRAKFIEIRGTENVNSDKLNFNGINHRLNLSMLNDLTKNIISADSDAFYAKSIKLDLSTIAPNISGPNSVKLMKPVTYYKQNEVKINKAYLVSCVNGRANDFSEAAKILKDKKVAVGVKFYIAAASSEVQNESQKRGDWQILLDAGAIPLSPGCGPCIGLGEGLLEENEVGISATNRNFKGRMGAASAKAYLASPSVVAYSAMAGKIDFDWNNESEIIAEIKVNTKESAEIKKVKIIDGFAEKLVGELIFCYQDNLNTDGIYPGKYTYNDDFTPEQQAQVVMENYDPEFVKIVNNGDFLVGGFNFGTGSSREQAATALKYKGISLVIAGTFNETYKRNAINNGFLVIECPELVRDLKSKFGNEKLTVKTGIKVEIDFSNSKIITAEKSYSIDAVGEAAQELIICGGLENWVKEKIN